MIDQQKQEMELQKIQIAAAKEAKELREQEAIERGSSVLINIVDPEDVSHPYRAFSKTWESFESQFGNMIKKNEMLENEIYKYKKRISDLESAIKAIESSGSSTIIQKPTVKKPDFDMDDDVDY